MGRGRRLQIIGLGALVNELGARAKQDGAALLLGCLGLDKAHSRAQGRLDNRFSIGAVVLVPLDKGPV